MTCEHEDCTNKATIDCADCWPWKSLCDDHIDGHEHEVDEADAAASIAQSEYQF